MMQADKPTLIRIITTYLPEAKIYLFGSRARKDYSSTSDIDIAIDIKKKIDSVVLSAIKENIEESSIPFTVDVIDLNNVSEDFKNEILKDAVIWN